MFHTTWEPLPHSKSHNPGSHSSGRDSDVCLALSQPGRGMHGKGGDVRWRGKELGQGQDEKMWFKNSLV